MGDLNTNELRAISGGILLILAIVYLMIQAHNQSIEYVLIALAGFLVGGAFFKDKEKQ